MNLKKIFNLFGRGILTVDEVGRGMHKCFINAGALVADAEYLIIFSPERSISLARLALEEIGKIILLANAAAKCAISKISMKKFQKDFKLYSHQNKLLTLAVYGSTILDKISTIKKKGRTMYQIC